MGLRGERGRGERADRAGPRVSGQQSPEPPGDGRVRLAGKGCLEGARLSGLGGRKGRDLSPDLDGAS